MRFQNGESGSAGGMGPEGGNQITEVIWRLVMGHCGKWVSLSQPVGLRPKKPDGRGTAVSDFGYRGVVIGGPAKTNTRRS